MPLRARRGTKAALVARAAANDLREGDLSYLVDRKALAVETGPNTYKLLEVERPIRSGLYLTAAATQIAPGTQVLAANTLRAFPWHLKSSATFVGLRSEVSTLVAATTYRLGIYADNGSAYPGDLITGSDIGDFASATAGLKTATFGTQINLQSGWYWVAVTSNGGPTLRSIPVAAIENLLGVQGSLGSGSSFTGWTIARAFGPLPSTFPAGAALLSNTPAPLVGFTTQ
jgi:hypothetical protein